jgi:hypothetical protein
MATFVSYHLYKAFLKLGLSDQEAILAAEVPGSLVREDILSQHRQEVEAVRCG